MPSILPAARAGWLVAALALACARSEDDAPGPAPNAAERQPAAPTAPDPRVAKADSARIMGSPTAPVWIIEVSDFQCPYCKIWHDKTYPTLKREYVDAGKARLAYVNFPLGQHKHARAAAEAAMCAGVQGRFWEMHGALFDAQARWASLRDPSAVFAALASAVGVDPARLRECIASGVLRPLIQADRDRAVDAGVNSTPSFLIGGARIEGAYPIADFRRVVDSVLAATPGAARTP